MFAPVLRPAPVVVGLNKVLCLPVWALLLVVLVAVWLSSKILPVVRVHTNLPIVRSIAVRAPYSLEVEHIKVSILFKLVKQVHSYLRLRVGKGAHVAIVARLQTQRVARTKLQFVLLRVVKLLHSVVAHLACITILALLTVRLPGTSLRSVGAKRTSFVLLCVVVEEAFFWIMLVCQLTGLRLKGDEVNEHHLLVVLLPELVLSSFSAFLTFPFVICSFVLGYEGLGILGES